MALTALNDCEPPRHLHDGQRAALRRPHAAALQRHPVDLAFMMPRHGAVALRADPDLAFGPQRQRAQFRDLGMVGGDAVRQRQAARVEDPGLGAHVPQQARGLLGQEAAVGALAQRAVQQQDARRMRGRPFRAPACRGPARPGTARRGWEGVTSPVLGCSDLRSLGGIRGTASAARTSRWLRLTNATTDSITGTSTSTPTTVASAAPDLKPNRLMAAATASSKKLEAPISAEGPATLYGARQIRLRQ